MKNHRLIRFLLIITSILMLSACEPEEYTVVRPPSVDYAGTLYVPGRDYPDLINTVAIDIVRANIIVSTTSRKTLGSLVYDSVTFYGTGVIVYHDDELDYYLALTAYHVVAIEEGYTSATYTVYDYQDYELTGVELIYGDPEFDLALIKIPSDYDDMYVMPLAEGNPAVNSRIFTLGTPLMQRNSFTTGNVTQYADGNLELDSSQIAFDVIYHDAYVNSGASGGMLFNAALQLVGINYAITWNELNVFRDGLAVPVQKIRYFLESNEEFDEYRDYIL